MKLSKKEALLFERISNDIIQKEAFLEMKNYLQHGSISTYEHSLNVSHCSLYLMKRLHLKGDEISLIRGALLHDLFLYDWHEKDETHRWHGFHHPKKAHDNALIHYEINALEKEIILSHMWPLTFRSFPKRKEAMIVCIADKIVSTMETIHIQYKREKEKNNEYKL